MKRLAMATVVLTALAVGAQAGDLPKPVRLVERLKMYSPTHYVRGAKAGKGGGASQSTTAEARQEAPAPKPADQPKSEPKPAKAD
jgi:opacity protein-like surface antigen